MKWKVEERGDRSFHIFKLDSSRPNLYHFVAVRSHPAAVQGYIEYRNERDRQEEINNRVIKTEFYS